MMHHTAFFLYVSRSMVLVWMSFCVACFLSDHAVSNEPSTDVPEGFELQWSSDFSNERALEAFEFTDSKAWKLNDTKGRPALELIGGSRYSYKVESPSSIALLKSQVYGDFLLEAKLLQTGAEYGHRDLCVFFGFQDAGHYYYAHFASKTDPRANQVFIVNDQPFTKISTQTTDGSHWGQDQWHQVRVQRIGTKISVWFDDINEPAMLADDHSFGAGYIGLGSYNDSGMFADVRIWAPSVKRSEQSPSFFSDQTGEND